MDRIGKGQWRLGICFSEKESHFGSRNLRTYSLARAMNFNKVNVKKLFDKLGEVFERKQFRPENIYNVYDTGCSTVRTIRKVIATKASNKWETIFHRKERRSLQCSSPCLFSLLKIIKIFSYEVDPMDASLHQPKVAGCVTIRFSHLSNISKNW